MVKQGTKGFTLLELMAVTVIIMIMIAVTTVSFANSRPSVKIKRDAAHMVSFLRNMWDRTKTTGDPLVLEPNFEDGTLSYTDPLEGRRVKAKFESEARIIAIKINDRLYSRSSIDVPLDQDESYSDAFFDTGIYLSEGRGLTRFAVIFGMAEHGDDPLDEWEYLTMCKLNLVTGKGSVVKLDPEELQELFEQAETEALEREMQN